MRHIKAFENYLEVIASFQGEHIHIESKEDVIKANSLYNKMLAKQMFVKGSGMRSMMNDYQNGVREYVLSGGKTFYQSGTEVLLTKSTRKDVEWQFTYFDSKGPVSHSDCYDMIEVAEYVKERSLVPLREEWLEFI